MPTMPATALRRDLYNTIERVNEDCTPIHITTTRGKGAVHILRMWTHYDGLERI